MSPELADALQWLQDCGGTMAMNNNPMAAQLIKAGLAKKGGYDHLGRRTLVLVGQIKTKATRETISPRTRSFFENLPRGKSRDFVSDCIYDVFVNSEKAHFTKENKSAVSMSFRRAVHYGINSLPAAKGFIIITHRNVADFDQHFGRANFDPETSEVYRSAGLHGVLNGNWTVLVSGASQNFHLWFYDSDVREGLHLRLT